MPAGRGHIRFEPPITLDVQLVTAAQAHLVATIPGFERPARAASDSRTTTIQSSSKPSSQPGVSAQWRKC